MTLSHYADPYLELHSDHRIIKAAIRALTNHFGDRDYTHCTSEDWLAFFKAMPRASVATLRRYRSSILTFLHWVSEDGKTDVSASIASLEALDLSAVVDGANSALLCGYFGSYDEMMDTAERIARQDGAEPLSSPILYTMFTLAWYGVPWRVALEVRKDEVKISDGLCTIQGRYHIRYERAVRVIESYLNAVLAYTPHDHTFAYQPSDRLFRSYKTSEITEESIQNRVAQFNMRTGDADVYFSLDKIRESAVFAKGYALMSNMGMKVTPTPHPALIPHFPKMFEFTPSELTKERYRTEAWNLFYQWCKKFRTVSPA